ncbi:helix-turn-helix domain-containing protein [Chryseobacterium sp. CBSDS_008]|uniref:helix-turn-helix domain-containing protein n=1 Tax=Chryseobacterium sp. CBSDS_008 TaxID=3415265 RepID=UPI003CEEC6C9
MSFFGTNIKKIRQVKGLSQTAFADLFDLNRGVISSYEEGRAEPKIETILKVASHFNLNLDQLLTETLQAGELVNVSDTDQLMLFPFQSSKEIHTKGEENSANETILQKILASVHVVYEFSPEKPLLPQYQYGDILFLNKADLKTDSLSNLVVYKDNSLQYASEAKNKNIETREYYKIIGYVSTADKNIFAGIFERLERLESNG